MKLVELLTEKAVIPEIRATKKNAVIRELAGCLARTHGGVTEDDVVRVLLERERLGSTAIGEGIAIPHGKLPSVSSVIACLGRSRKGVNFDSEDGQPAHFFIVMIAPASATGEHLKALARISRVFKNREFRSRLMAAENAAEIFRLIESEDSSAA
jgi:nitrogen PTS system EIIA component